MPQPELPEPAHPDLDSMLTRKFGKEVANYFSGSPLNRVSFLRTDQPFLSAALQHPSTTFLLFNDLSPLTLSPTRLASLTYTDILPLLGPTPPYSLPEADLISTYNSTHTTPQLLFLGLDERPPHTFTWKSLYAGTPLFALDITPRGTHAAAATTLLTSLTARTPPLTFLPSRTHMTLPPPSAAIYAQARALLDWNARNPYCAACGHPTLSINAGWKRTCPPRDLAALPTPTGSTVAALPPPRPSCATRAGGVSNLSFPRTDPTVIMAVVSADAERVLLGRQKRWPPLWYSTLAGFVEPAESIEEAVRREVWEEAGVRLGRVVVHSSQPWPYPANLMVGAVAQTVPGGEEIVLKHDPELEDAKWVGLGEVREALRVGTSGLGEGPGEGYVEGGLRLPPRTAIANSLLAAVCGGFLGGEARM